MVSVRSEKPICAPPCLSEASQCFTGRPGKELGHDLISVRQKWRPSGDLPQEARNAWSPSTIPTDRRSSLWRWQSTSASPSTRKPAGTAVVNDAVTAKVGNVRWLCQTRDATVWCSPLHSFYDTVIPPLSKATVDADGKEKKEDISLLELGNYHWRELLQVSFLSRKNVLSRQTRLSWQTETHVCRDKIRHKTFVATKIFLAAPVNDRKLCRCGVKIFSLLYCCD